MLILSWLEDDVLSPPPTTSNWGCSHEQTGGRFNKYKQICNITIRFGSFSMIWCFFDFSWKLCHLLLLICDLELKENQSQWKRERENTIYSRNAPVHLLPLGWFESSASLLTHHLSTFLTLHPSPPHRPPTTPSSLPPRAYSPVGALLIGFHSLQAEEEGRRYSWSSGDTDPTWESGILPPPVYLLWDLLATCL